MINTNYAFRNKKNGQLLSLDIDIEEEHELNGDCQQVKSHEIGFNGEYGRWTTDKIENVLFLKDLEFSNYSLEHPRLKVKKDDIEIVAIHSCNGFEIITTENVPQSLFVYFKNLDEVIRFSTVRSDFKYDENHAEDTAIKYENNEYHLDIYNFNCAWFYLVYLGRFQEIKITKNEFLSLINAEIKILEEK